MTKWSIDEYEILSVLELIDVTVSDIGECLEVLPETLESGVGGTASQVISEAVGELFTFEGPRLEGMRTRISASVMGVVNSTNAYVEGDLKMAGGPNRQRAKRSTRSPILTIKVGCGD